MLETTTAPDRPRMATDQNGQGVFLLGDGLLDHGNGRHRRLVLGRYLHHFELGDGAAVKAHLKHLDVHTTTFKGRLRDLQLAVQVEQGDVTGDDRGNERERDAEPCLLGGEQVGF